MEAGDLTEFWRWYKTWLCDFVTMTAARGPAWRTPPPEPTGFDPWVFWGLTRPPDGESAMPLRPGPQPENAGITPKRLRK